MESLLFLLIVAAGAGLFYFIPGIWRRRRRKKLLSTPFSEEWEKILAANLPPYRKFSQPIRRQLHDLIRIFIGEKSFEGCGGLEITDEIRVTIAAQACMLLLNREISCYPKLSSILVYPTSYVAGSRNGLDGTWEEESVRLGESWHSGAVVLAWDRVRHGALNFRDGHNVTMHEFAHQLDQEDGGGDGTPILQSRSAYSSWAQIFAEEYGLLQKQVERGKKSVMDEYGTTNPAEFFAVATENFFEKPRQLSRRHPELFRELKHYYMVNPLDWS